MSILNQYFRRIAHLPPALLIGLIGLLYAFLIFGRSEKPFYSDPGLMYLQTVDVLQRGNFVFDYQGRDIDPEYRLLPFRRPFLEKVNNEYYIDFPPYWPLINAPLLWLLDTPGLFIWNLTAFVLTLIVIAGITRIFLNTNAAINLAILLYSFGCAAPLYTLYFHEYTVALLPATLSFYLILRYVHSGERRRNAVLAGFCAAISLYFRLEFVFFYFAIGLYPLLRNRRLELRGGLLMLAGFALPFCVLLYCNQQIHGHPLGLRYTLTMNAVMGSPAGHPADTSQQADTESNTPTGSQSEQPDPTTPQPDESRAAPDTTPGDHLLDPLPDGGNDRLAIIQSLLFSRLRGLFYQSPFLLLGMFLWAYARWKRSARDLFPSAMVLLISGTLILLFAPNTGDHFAPRYLFVLIPPAIVLSVQALWIALRTAGSAARVIIVVLFVIGAGFAGSRTLANYQWVRGADRGIQNVLVDLASTSEDVIVFLEFASPLNVQGIMRDKTVFVVENADELDYLTQKLRIAAQQNAQHSEINHNDAQHEPDSNIAVEVPKKNTSPDFIIALPVMGAGARYQIASMQNERGAINIEQLKNIAPLLESKDGRILQSARLTDSYLLVHVRVTER